MGAGGWELTRALGLRVPRLTDSMGPPICGVMSFLASYLTSDCLTILANCCDFRALFLFTVITTELLLCIEYHSVFVCLSVFVVLFLEWRNN